MACSRRVRRCRPSCSTTTRAAACSARSRACPEYYPTRTEVSLLRQVAPEIGAGLRSDSALVEYGGSDESKAAILLDACPTIGLYVPIDVAAGALAALTLRLRAARPALAVEPIVADFLAPLRLPDSVAGCDRLGFFPGSTIGNLDPAEARAFLLAATAHLGGGRRFPRRRRLAQGSGDPGAGVRRCAGRHRRVQPQPAGAAQPRGRRGFRPRRLRPLRTLERRREPDGDASGQPEPADRDRPPARASRSQRARRSTPRTATNTACRPSISWPSGAAGASFGCGPTRPACSRSICSQPSSFEAGRSL